MKGLLTLVFLAELYVTAFSQRSVAKIFEQYSESDGYVTITLKGNLLNLFECDDDDDDNDSERNPQNITEIRILTQEDDSKDALNFIKMAARDIDNKDYEEYLSVRKSAQDIRMLIRQDGKFISEMLLIGGGEDNFIIQMKGKITHQEAEKIRRDIREDNGNGKGVLSNLN